MIHRALCALLALVLTLEGDGERAKYCIFEDRRSIAVCFPDLQTSTN